MKSPLNSLPFSCPRPTGTACAGGQGLGLAGKTGTVENSPSSDNPRGYNHAWFVGYGQGLAITVFLERSGGYGGALAAPIAVAILKAHLQSPP